MRWNNREVSGENHPNAKLSDEYRRCIRHAKGRVPANSLAKIFGVSPRTIRDQWAKTGSEGMARS